MHRITILTLSAYDCHPNAKDCLGLNNGRKGNALILNCEILLPA